MSRSTSANMFNSSYKNSFGPKATSRINIKELDACRNKIKYLIFYIELYPLISMRTMGGNHRYLSAGTTLL